MSTRHEPRKQLGMVRILTSTRLSVGSKYADFWKLKNLRIKAPMERIWFKPQRETVSKTKTAAAIRLLLHRLPF